MDYKIATGMKDSFLCVGFGQLEPEIWTVEVLMKIVDLVEQLGSMIHSLLFLGVRAEGRARRSGRTDSVVNFNGVSACDICDLG